MRTCGTKGDKVRLVADCFECSPDADEPIAEFWGIAPDSVGEIIGFQQPPFPHHPIVHWNKIAKPSFQDVAWHPSNLLLAKRQRKTTNQSKIT